MVYLKENMEPILEKAKVICIDVVISPTYGGR